ncbi:DUF6776 family protein, partial [Acidiferrobacter sp.]
VAAVLIVLGGFALYEYGESVAGFNIQAASLAKTQADAKISHLRREIVRLQASLAISKRSLQTDTVAYGDLATALKRSDQQLISLREKLGFYHAILGAPHKAAGVHIDKFHLVRGAKTWHYNLVLIQSLAFQRWVYASIRFTVQGRMAGHSSDVDYPRLVDTPLTVHFKYFSDVQGRLALPAGFIPQRVIVTVAATGHTIKQAYPWPHEK